MEQTAVEWLVEKIQQAKPNFKFDALIREAKEMEKEQKKEYNYYKEYWEVRNLKKNKITFKSE